jgi:hypothetical protein
VSGEVECQTWAAAEPEGAEIYYLSRRAFLRRSFSIGLLAEPAPVFRLSSGAAMRARQRAPPLLVGVFSYLFSIDLDQIAGNSRAHK